jgi:histidyl-tRNA synthetase
MIPKQLLTSPSGFLDLSPAEAIAQSKFLDIVRRRFERAGFSPLETPLVEREAVLAAKGEGEISTQIYGLRLLNPDAEAVGDEKELAVRFDHTVPLARYLATHSRELPFPFRRYAIGPVLRGEKPNMSKGRYRQFTQADIDVIGDGALSPLHDAEMAAIISDIFTEFNIGSFTIRINNRKVLSALLAKAGIGEESVASAMRIIDRLEKVGRGKTAEDLEALGMPAEVARELVEALTAERSSADTLKYLEGHLGDEPGVTELRIVIEALKDFGVPDANYRIDLSIARGLEYYTGTVYETRLDAHPDLGSIASGGRYEDLASAYIDRPLPGVGISIGVTRLLLRLIGAGLVLADTSAVAPVLVTTAERAYLSTYLRLATELRQAGVPCEVYLEDKALDKQLHFADRKGYRYALIAQMEQIVGGRWILRDLRSGEQRELAASDLAAELSNESR